VELDAWKHLLVSGCRELVTIDFSLRVVGQDLRPLSRKSGENALLKKPIWVHHCQLVKKHLIDGDDVSVLKEAVWKAAWICLAHDNPSERRMELEQTKNRSSPDRLLHELFHRCSD